MKSPIRTALNRLTLALLIAGVTCPLLAGGDDPAAGKADAVFTLDEALQQLRLYPKDAYLQYVALQLARRENRVDKIARQVDGILGNEEGNRRDQVDLFSIFTGALAVQESLQLDTMRGGLRGRARQIDRQFTQQQEQQDFLGIIPGGVASEMSDKLGVRRLILKGIGNQIGLHIYDAPPTFDFNLPAFLGEALGSMNGRGMIHMGGM